VTSFTAFASHAGQSLELPDRDEIAAPEPHPPESVPDQPFSIFAFPRGARAGIVLHGIFETLDFASGVTPALQARVGEALSRAGYGDEWLPAVAGMVRHVLTVPLPAPSGSFALAELTPGSWLAELEFFFPLRFVTADGLREAARQWSGRDLAVNLEAIFSALRFTPVKGMVRGFVDLVCEHGGRYYLIDWKSNHLGNTPEDYAPARLRDAMERNLYHLQYLLYAVALHRHLATRLPGYDYDTHFGGVFYLFLRGIDAARGAETGVFADRPPRQVVEGLARVWIDA